MAVALDAFYTLVDLPYEATRNKVKQACRHSRYAAFARKMEEKWMGEN